MRSKNRVTDKRTWQRMGLELAALHDLIVLIETDLDYQDVMDRKTWDRLSKLTYHLNVVRGLAESRMAAHVPDWSTRTFYPIDRERINTVIAEFRRCITEAADE